MLFKRKGSAGRSRTKIGVLIVGIGAILLTAGAVYTGDMTLMKAIPLIVTEIGGILAVFGIRDLPVLNGKK